MTQMKSDASGLKQLDVHPRYPRNIKEVYSLGEGLTIRGALEDANERRIAILSNKLIDIHVNEKKKPWSDERINQRLVDRETVGRDQSYKTFVASLFAGFNIMTGTLIAHTKPGEKFGKRVIAEDCNAGLLVSIAIPKKYQKAKDCALVMNHGFSKDGTPNFEVSVDYKTGTREPAEAVWHVHDESRFELIENFPTEDGWYQTESGFCIPIGVKIEPSNQAARHLGRSEDGHVGMVFRQADEGEERHITMWETLRSDYDHYQALVCTLK